MKHFVDCTTPWDCDCRKKHGRLSGELKRYLLVLAVVLVILAVEILGSYLSGSFALLADAGHVFTDSLAVISSIVVVLLVLQNRKEEEVRRVGFYFQIALMALVVAGITYEAIGRLQEVGEIHSAHMLWAALVGLGGNGVQLGILQSAHKHHRNQNHRAIHLHVLSDLAVSVGVVVGSIAILVSGWYIIDPILSLVIAVWIAWRTISLIKNPHGYHH